ncbi:hypothetical protein Gotur_008086 [Gossypium turneri]
MYRWNHGQSYVGVPDELENIRLLLDQCSKPRLITYPFQTYINYAMILYATVEMHESNRVLWQFRIESIPARESFFSTDTVEFDDYLTWFRAVGKPYLLPPEVRSRYIFRGIDVSRVLHPHIDVDVEPHVEKDTDVFTATNDDTDVDDHVVVDDDVDTQYLFNSTTEEHYDAVDPKEMIAQGAVLGIYSGDDDDEKQVYKPVPPDTPPVVHPIVHRNPPRNYYSSSCGTHSPQRQD